jgi:hypothetical protein
MAQYTGTNVVIWTDNQSILHAINKVKSHHTTHFLLCAIFHLTARLNISIKAVYIPTHLNTTADLLSRHVFAALHTHYTITRNLFAAIGGLRTNVCAFATPDTRSALYLYANKTSKPTIYTPLHSFFLHLNQLVGKAIWFNPPFPLILDTLTALVQVYSQAPQRTYMLGIIPYIPTRPWFYKYVGTNHIFHIKHIIPHTTPCIVSCGTQWFKTCPIQQLKSNSCMRFRITKPTCDMAIIETNPCPTLGALQAILKGS